jgi:hypothetical protein
MYGALWRLLPGPRPLKALVSLILVVGVVVVCFLWLFPAIAPLMPFNDNSVQTGLSSPGATSSFPSAARQ